MCRLRHTWLRDSLRQNTEEKVRGKELKDDMNHGSDVEVQEERSEGIEIRIADAFVIIKTDHTLQISETRNVKEAKLVRFL